jgi:transposase
MKNSGLDRKYTQEFRLAAVKQVMDGGRSIRQVARSLEMSPGTLGNWVSRTNKGEGLMKRPPGRPVTELEAELARLKQENARLRIEKEILKKAAAYFAKESM